MRKLLTIISMLVSLVCLSQEGQFSQFYASSVFLNPALAGLQPEFTLSTNYKRSQASRSGAYHEMYQASITMPIQRVAKLYSQSGGIGLTMSNERVGVEGLYQTTKVLLTGAYVLSLDRRNTQKLSFGLQGGVVQNRLNSESLQFGSQYNPYMGFDSFLPGEAVAFEPIYTPVFSLGALLSISDHFNPEQQNNTMQMGVAIDYLNRPEYGFLLDESGEAFKRPMFFKYMTTTRFRLSQKLFIHPSALVIGNQQNYQFNMGTYISTYLDNRLQSMLQLGAWYRYLDSFIILSGLQVNKFRVGVSFDLNTRSLNPNDAIFKDSFQPSYELSLSYGLGKTGQPSDPLMNVNPAF